MRTLIICAILSIFTLVAHSQIGGSQTVTLNGPLRLSTANPGNWSFVSNYNTEWSRTGLNGKDIVYDSSNFVITCDTARKTIYFTQISGKARDTIIAVKYELIETWLDDPAQLKKGVFYYRTDEMGTIELWPGEMVARSWPGQFRKQYLKQLILRPKTQATPKPKVAIVKKTTVIKTNK